MSLYYYSHTSHLQFPFSYSPDKIDADFTLIVEVYCSVLASDSSISSTVASSTPAGKESTPMKMFRKIKKVKCPMNTIYFLPFLHRSYHMTISLVLLSRPLPRLCHCHLMWLQCQLPIQLIILH